MSTAPDGTEASDGASSFSVSISEPAALDPGLTSEIEGSQVIRLLFQPLTTLTRISNWRPVSPPTGRSETTG